MKKQFIILALLAICLPTICSAQLHIKEDYTEGAKLYWVEQATKKTSALVKNGYIELISKDKGIPTQIWVEELPLDLQNDFTIKAKVLVPKMSDDERCFGIIFNKDGRNIESSNIYYVFSSTQCRVFKSKVTNIDEMEYSEPTAYITSTNKGWPIKLPEGKDKTIEIEISYVGGKVCIRANDMIAAHKHTEEIYAPIFGFWTRGGSSLKITEVEVIQENYQE